MRHVAPHAEVYVIGGAAEGRLTIMSDIDVLIVLPKKPSFSEAVELREGREEGGGLGLPPYAPIELHIAGKDGLRENARRGRVIPVGRI